MQVRRRPRGGQNWVVAIAQVAIVALLAASYLLYQDRVSGLQAERAADQATVAEVQTIAAEVCGTADPADLRAQGLVQACATVASGLTLNERRGALPGHTFVPIARPCQQPQTTREARACGYPEPRGTTRVVAFTTSPSERLGRIR